MIGPHTSLMRPSEGTLGILLQQHSLTLENCEGLLEPCYFSLSSSFALSIRLGLRDAHLVKLREVLQKCIEFSLDAILIRGSFRHCFVEGCGFLGLVFQVLFFADLGELVLLGSLL